MLNRYRFVRQSWENRRVLVDRVLVDRVAQAWYSQGDVLNQRSSAVLQERVVEYVCLRIVEPLDVSQFDASVDDRDLDSISLFDDVD